jgi:dipeptidase E
MSFWHARWDAGAVLSGISAGMLCWFEAMLTDSSGELQSVVDGLGLIAGSACAHYDRDVRAHFHRAIAGGLPAGYALDDGAALHFVGGGLVEAVSSTREAKAYRASLADGRVVEAVVRHAVSGRPDSAPVKVRVPKRCA